MTAPSGSGVTLPAGCRLVALDAVGSTQVEARRLADAGAPDLTFVWARQQLAGRGRRGRSWRSPPGNLHLSILLRPAPDAAGTGQLGFAAALAVADAVSELLPQAAPRLKWPNDVLLGPAKLAGVLAESGAAAGGGAQAIVGIGVNVARHPAGLAYPATSLAACGCPAAAPQVLAAVARRFVAWRQRLQAQGFAPLRAAWLARAHGLGAAAAVRLADGTVRGVFAGLDARGALVLRLPGGATRTVTAGDVLAAAA